MRFTLLVAPLFVVLLTFACGDGTADIAPPVTRNDGGISGNDGGVSGNDGGAPPEPTDGILQVSDLEVSKGLYYCIDITHISSAGVKTPVPRNATVKFSGAETLVAPLSAFPAGVPQDCSGFPLKGLSAGAGAMQVQWGAAKGMSTVVIDGSPLKIEPGFFAPPKNGDPTIVVSSVGYPVPLGLLASTGGKGYMPPNALAFQVTPNASVQVAPAGRQSNMTAKIPGQYTVSATFEGKSYSGKNKLEVYDLSGATLQSLDRDTLAMSGITKGTITRMGIAYHETFTIDSSGSLFDVSDATACADLLPTGSYVLPDNTVVPGVVPSAKLAFRDRLGTATLSGNKLCVTKAGDGALDISAPGVDTVTHQFALGTSSLTNLTSAVALSENNLGYTICATVNATLTDKEGAKLDVSASPSLAVDIDCKDCGGMPMNLTLRNSKTGNKYCHTLANGQTVGGKKNFDVTIGFGTMSKTVSAVLQ